jgi:hypothetical protein
MTLEVIHPLANAFPCPECAAAGATRVFSRAASLGTHRKRSHGVAGGARRRPAAGDVKETLLALVFPNGIPARLDVLARLGPWLEEGEQLAAHARSNGGA